MYTQQQIKQFRTNLSNLYLESIEPLHPESIRMINADIKRIESILADYPEVVEESEKVIEYNTPIKWTTEDTALFQKLNTLTIYNVKKSDHFPKYFEVVKLVEECADNVNRWIFDTEGYEMGLYKRAVFDKASKKECDNRLSNVKRWMVKQYVDCMNVKYQ